MIEFYALAQQCALAVHPATMAAVVRVESTFNPFAIGVVGGRLARQPTNKAEAVATANALTAAGVNFSLGMGQVNRYNLSRYGLDYQSAFEPCANLKAASLILQECYRRAKAKGMTDTSALQAAFSCYYSGNFLTGFTADFKGQPSYVQKVLNSAVAVGVAGQTLPIRVVSGVNATTKRRVSTVVHNIHQAPDQRPKHPDSAGNSSAPRVSVMVYR
ncbi:lytic transglycosylase domain-containing protein [Massilia sp. H6]|uniref:lytic transglycosylase domain-containing protein n=1 Tax=Massilia sp. H6 TaxID=2970464 RepID=UPI0035A3D314